MNAEYNSSLDNLLELNGVCFFVDEAGKYTVKFVVIRVPVSGERPHGLSYSLTLHDEHGDRLVGFDNAHPIRTKSGPAGKSGKVHDHKHMLKTVRPYEYQDAETLLADFWEQVDSMLREKGAIS